MMTTYEWDMAGIAHTARIRKVDHDRFQEQLAAWREQRELVIANTAALERIAEVLEWFRDRELGR